MCQLCLRVFFFPLRVFKQSQISLKKKSNYLSFTEETSKTLGQELKKKRTGKDTSKQLQKEH